MSKRNPKSKPEEIEYSVSSGNVYADFGFPNPEEAKTKAELAMLISEIIKEKNLTQQQAADLMDIDQPKVSKIIRGLLSEFSIERLLKFVLALGFDIEITPKPHKTKSTPPGMRISNVFQRKGYPQIRRHRNSRSVVKNAS
jgi:predicted XRE-type DNA-binding protein